MTQALDRAAANLVGQAGEKGDDRRMQDYKERKEKYAMAVESGRAGTDSDCWINIAGCEKSGSGAPAPTPPMPA